MRVVHIVKGIVQGAKEIGVTVPNTNTESINEKLLDHLINNSSSLTQIINNLTIR